MSELATAPPTAARRRDRLLVASAVAWLLASAQFLVVHVVVQSAWPTPYGWAANTISDLGNVTCRDWDGRPVCSPLHAAMNVSFAVTGVLIVVGIGCLCVALRRLPRLGHWLLAVEAASWVLVGAVPADVDENLHLLGALGIFVVGSVGLVLLVRSRADAFPGLVAAWVAPVLGVLGLVGAVLFATGHDLGLGGGGMERVAAYGLPVWMLVAGASMLIRRARAMT